MTEKLFTGTLNHNQNKQNTKTFFSLVDMSVINNWKNAFTNELLGENLRLGLALSEG